MKPDDFFELTWRQYKMLMNTINKRRKHGAPM